MRPKAIVESYCTDAGQRMVTKKTWMKWALFLVDGFCANNPYVGKDMADRFIIIINILWKAFNAITAYFYLSIFCTDTHRVIIWRINWVPMNLYSFIESSMVEIILFYL